MFRPAVCRKDGCSKRGYSHLDGFCSQHHPGALEVGVVVTAMADIKPDPEFHPRVFKQGENAVVHRINDNGDVDLDRDGWDDYKRIPAKDAKYLKVAEKWTCGRCGETGNYGGKCDECGQARPGAEEQRFSADMDDRKTKGEFKQFYGDGYSYSYGGLEDTPRWQRKWNNADKVFKVTKQHGKVGIGFVGSRISEVTPGGAAEAAGLRAGMNMSRINGIAVSMGDECLAQFRAAPDTFNIEVAEKYKLGRYIVVFDGQLPVTSGRLRSTEKVAEITKGKVVNVVEAGEADEGRTRARIEEPPVWISLGTLHDRQLFAEYQAERRLDPREEFVSLYGGTKEWDAAIPAGTPSGYNANMRGGVHSQLATRMHPQQFWKPCSTPPSLWQ